MIGGGGIGGLLAGRLSLSNRVTKLGILLRSNFESVKQNGFIVKSNIVGKSQFTPKNVYSLSDKSFEEAKNEKWDHILCCVKTTMNRVLCESILTPILAENESAMIHLIQNGVGIEESVHDCFPNNPLVSVSAFVRSSIDDEGAVNHSGPKLFTFGFFSPAKPSSEIQDKLHQLCAALEDGSIDTKISNDIQWVRYHKLAWNASFNPLSIICGHIGCVSLLNTPETRELVLEIHREVFELATRLLGQRPDYLDNYDDFLARTEKLNQQNGEYFPSMLLDFKKGKPLEIEAICGNPVRIAKRIGVKVPRLETVYQIIKKLSELS